MADEKRLCPPLSTSAAANWSRRHDAGQLHSRLMVVCLALPRLHQVCRAELEQRPQPQLRGSRNLCLHRPP